MRVLQLVNSADTGGAQTLIEALGRRLGPDVEMHTAVLLGADVLSPRLEAVSASLTHLGLTTRTLRADRAAAAVRALVRRHGVDVVHSHLFQADVVNILTRGSHGRVTTVHTTGMTASDPVRSRLLARAVAVVSARAFDASVACGPAAQAYMRRAGYGSTSDVVRNGVPVPEAPPAARERSGVVLCLSRWHPMKDHATLLDAFAVVAAADARATLVLAGSGTGPDNDELAAMVRHRGLERRVARLGPVQDVGELLARAELLVISSSYGEALPMAGAEALAAGLPVVSTDVGDCATLTGDPRLLCRPRDPDALARAIRTVLGVPGQEYDDLARESWARARTTLSVDEAVDRYRALYERVVAAASRAVA